VGDRRPRPGRWSASRDPGPRGRPSSGSADLGRQPDVDLTACAIPSGLGVTPGGARRARRRAWLERNLRPPVIASTAPRAASRRPARRGATGPGDHGCHAGAALDGALRDAAGQPAAGAAARKASPAAPASPPDRFAECRLLRAPRPRAV